jgi:4-amino-4-deoxy-L-arabinose transferase-like glycosyltransferase
VIVGGFALGVAVWLGPLFYELARQQGGEIESYAQELLFKQTATRYVASWHHVQPWWYFLQVIFTLWLPGALLLPFLAKLWWPGVKRFDMKTVLLLGWVVLVLIFFSVSPGKREVYILPALPAVCLMAAPYVSSLLARRSCGRLLIAYLLVLVVASAVAAVGLLADQALWRKLLEGRDIAHGSQHALGMWLLALSVGIAAILSWTGVRRAGEAVVVSSALIWFCYGVGFMPALDPYASAAYLMERVEERLGPNDQLAMIGWREQNLLQARRPVTEFGFKAPVEEQKRRAALWISGRPERKFILIPESEADGCIEGAGATRVGQANRVTWLLAPASAIGGSCSAIK